MHWMRANGRAADRLGERAREDRLRRARHVLEQDVAAARRAPRARARSRRACRARPARCLPASGRNAGGAADPLPALLVLLDAPHLGHGIRGAAGKSRARLRAWLVRRWAQAEPCCARLQPRQLSFAILAAVLALPAFAGCGGSGDPLHTARKAATTTLATDSADDDELSGRDTVRRDTRHDRRPGAVLVSERAGIRRRSTSRRSARGQQAGHISSTSRRGSGPSRL